MRYMNLILVFAVMGGSALYSAAQTPKRIQFAKGKSSTVIKGMTGNNGIGYVLRARSGQKLILVLSPANAVGVKVETTGRYGPMILLREAHGGHYEIGLGETEMSRSLLAPRPVEQLLLP